MSRDREARRVPRHVPRRRFGQHFLVDEPTIAAIVDGIAPQPADRVAEIGPGLGALTSPLAARLSHLHVIEIDRDIVARLRTAYPAGHVTVHQDDALRFDFTALGPQLRVVGNLPYNISTPLLFHLARHAPAIRDIHVMLQKEVVERMVAVPATSEYGRLSVMLQYRFEMKYLLTVPPDAFHPAPKVESAVVRMVPYLRPPQRARDEIVFARIVAAAFSQRRKTLRNTLRAYFKAVDFELLGVDAGLRAQDLGVSEFVRMADRAANGASR